MTPGRVRGVLATSPGLTIRATGARAGKWPWAILDSNQGPPPYQSGALTN